MGAFSPARSASCCNWRSIPRGGASRRLRLARLGVRFGRPFGPLPLRWSLGASFSTRKPLAAFFRDVARRSARAVLRRSRRRNRLFAAVSSAAGAASARLAGGSSSAGCGFFAGLRGRDVEILVFVEDLSTETALRHQPLMRRGRQTLKLLVPRHRHGGVRIGHDVALGVEQTVRAHHHVAQLAEAAVLRREPVACGFLHRGHAARLKVQQTAQGGLHPEAGPWAVLRVELVQPGGVPAVLFRLAGRLVENRDGSVHDSLLFLMPRLTS